MTPCLWTSVFVELTPEDALRRLAGLGWQCFELSCEHIAVIRDDADPLGRAKQVREVANSLGVRIDQVHLLIEADVASSDPARRASDLAKIEREIACCGVMGIPVGVLHPGGFETVTTEAAEDVLSHNRILSFAQIAAWATAAGMKIAVENMADVIGIRSGRRRVFGSVIPELLALIGCVGSPALGICFDTSHANVQGLDLAAAIRECGDKLIALHVSDNDGSGDQHRTPYNGGIDWVPVVAALSESGYAYPFNLEIPGERLCPYPVIDAKMKAALETVKWLVA